MTRERRAWVTGMAITIVIVAVAALAMFHLPARTGEEAGAQPIPASTAPASNTGIPSLDAHINGMKATCSSVEAADAPAADKPTKAEKRSLKGCRSTDLYYGVNGHKDLRKARLCAFVEWESADVTYSDTVAGPGGAGLLAMIYANGEGVEPDYAFATRMACLAGYSSMDQVMAIELVQNRKSDPSARVEICDAAGSGWFAGQCAADQSHRDDLERDARVARLQRRWPAAWKQSWKSVVASRTAFEGARTENEIDLSGTLRTAYAVAAEGRIRDFDEVLLKDLVSGRLSGGASAARIADEGMNQAYRKLMAEPVDEFTWPPRSSVRKTQKVWLRHRDSWRRFAETVRPGSGDAAVARLTAERRDMLSCLLEQSPDDLECRDF